MAAEAEATREARAKVIVCNLLIRSKNLRLVDLQVIAAEGEQKASRALKEASDIISESPAALQLRFAHNIIHKYSYMGRGRFLKIYPFCFLFASHVIVQSLFILPSPDICKPSLPSPLRRTLLSSSQFQSKCFQSSSRMTEEKHCLASNWRLKLCRLTFHKSKDVFTQQNTWLKIYLKIVRTPSLKYLMFLHWQTKYNISTTYKHSTM